MDLRSAFAAGRQGSPRNPVLIGFLPAGFPDDAGFLSAARAIARAGFSILEVGIPASAAGMDGRIIEEANAKVLRGGMDVMRAVALAGRASGESGLPTVAMMYFSTVRSADWDGVLAACHEAGVAGVLVPDVPLEEWKGFCGRARRAGVDPVGFIPPSADEARLRTITGCARGFIYVPSYEGRTGETLARGTALEARLPQVKAVAAQHGLPVGVGFGLHTRKDIMRVRSLGAEAAIIGTALVEAAGKGAEALEGFLSGITAGPGGA